MDHERGSDRRKHERYGVSEDVFLTFRPDFDRIGKLRDVSVGGVSFEYTTGTENSNPEVVDVDIFSTAKQLHLARIPCRVIYDVPLDAQATFANIDMRRCGLEFRRLSTQQISQLASIFPSQSSLGVSR